MQSLGALRDTTHWHLLQLAPSPELSAQCFSSGRFLQRERVAGRSTHACAWTRAASHVIPATAQLVKHLTGDCGEGKWGAFEEMLSSQLMSRILVGREKTGVTFSMLSSELMSGSL